MDNVQKKIVVFGSSVADGWTPYFISYMAPYGYNILNRSVPGNKTIDLLNRFDSDVMPDNSDFVIIALSLANEGLPGSVDPEAVCSQYKRNLARLVDMCKEQNIVPCLTTAYSCNEYTPEEWACVRRVNDEIASWGIHIFDIRGALDDLAGHWLPGTYADSRHPNPDGYQQIVYAIPPAAFESDTPKPLEPAMSSLGSSALYRAQTPLKAFTVSVEVRINDALSDETLIDISKENGSFLRVQAFRSTFVLAGLINGTDIKSTSVYTDREFHTLSVSFVPGDGGHVRFYIDGYLCGKSRTGYPGDASVFSVGNSSDACEVQNLCVYRTRLDDNQLLAIHRRQFPTGSLELFAPLYDIQPEDGSLPLQEPAP